MADVVVEIEAVAVAVESALHAADEAEAAGIADDGIGLQRGEPAEEAGRDLAHVLEDALLPDDLDGLQRRRAAHRIAGVGVAVVEQQVRARPRAHHLQHRPAENSSELTSALRNPIAVSCFDNKMKTNIS